MNNEAKQTAAIRKFCSTMSDAKSAWEASGGDHRSWMVYADIKDGAFCALQDAIPEIGSIGRLNQILIDHGPEAWARVIAAKLRSAKNGISCRDCGKKVPYPAIRCDKCAEAFLQLKKEQAEVAKILKGTRPRKAARKVRRRKSLTVMRRQK